MQTPFSTPPPLPRAVFNGRVDVDRLVVLAVDEHLQFGFAFRRMVVVLRELDDHLVVEL